MMFDEIMTKTALIQSYSAFLVPVIFVHFIFLINYLIKKIKGSR
jgi:hypothetical protein